MPDHIKKALHGMVERMKQAIITPEAYGILLGRCRSAQIKKMIH